MVDSHFQVQLTAVLDVLMKSAVADICALTESWFKSLHLEITKSKQENEDLRQTLQLLQQDQQLHQPCDDQQHQSHQQPAGATDAEEERSSTKVEEEEEHSEREGRPQDGLDAGCTVSGTSAEGKQLEEAADVQLWSTAPKEQRKKTTFCHICLKDVGSLQSHMEWHNQTLKCQICHRVFYNSDVYSRHIDMHTGTMYACDVCRKTFGSKGGLLKHLSHHKEDLEKCKDCGQEFPTKQTLYSHREKAHSVPKKCPFCHLAFSRNSNLKKHLQRHLIVNI